MGNPTRLTDLERRAWRGVVALNVRLLRILERRFQTDSGISPQDYEVLVNLHKALDGRMRAHELGAAMTWEKSRLSKHLTRMEGRGLIRREACESDHRGSFVALTQEGRESFAQAEPLHLAHVRELFLTALDDAQLDQMGAISEAVSMHLDRHAQVAEDSRGD